MGEKPIDYFISDGIINGIPFTGYTDLILTKKHGITGLTETICLPKIKIV